MRQPADGWQSVLLSDRQQQGITQRHITSEEEIDETMLFRREKIPARYCFPRMRMERYLALRTRGNCFYSRLDGKIRGCGTNRRRSDYCSLLLQSSRHLPSIHDSVHAWRIARRNKCKVRTNLNLTFIL